MKRSQYTEKLSRYTEEQVIGILRRQEAEAKTEVFEGFASQQHAAVEIVDSD